MAKTIDVSSYESYSDLTGRLDQIVAEVRNKETSLETSLDLLDEAIALGSKAVDLVESLEGELAEEQAEQGADVSDNQAMGEQGTNQTDKHASDQAAAQAVDQTSAESRAAASTQDTNG
ncbi:MAG: exodeoxyribonuclease VII small subunit [Atopobiaceae bacterium]|nr:exodeoxyribonuclease VII small subunit [Atopobiaceae bacterium]